MLTSKACSQLSSNGCNIPVKPKYRFHNSPKIRASEETLPEPKRREAKKQLPEDSSCSWAHKVNRDAAQVLTAHGGGLLLRC